MGDEARGREQQSMTPRPSAYRTATAMATATTTTTKDGDGGGGGREQRQVKRRPISARQMGEQRAACTKGRSETSESFCSFAGARPAHAGLGGGSTRRAVWVRVYTHIHM